MAGLIYDDVIYSSGGEANVIESISVNNSPVTPVNKNVNINIPSSVSVAHSGTASSTVVRKQTITVNNVDYDIDGTAYMEQSVTLSTSTTTTITFTNAIITDGKMLTFASSKWDLVPNDMTTSSGSCTIELPKVDFAETIGCRLYVR